MHDYVLDILEQYLIWKKKEIEINYNYLSQDETDELRLEYDNDVKYYYKVLHMSKKMLFWLIQ